MESPMPQSSVAAACRSWNPLLPTDTAPVLPPAHLSSSPCWNMSCHQVPAPSICTRE